MKYKLVFNIPNEKFPTEVSISEEQMRNLEPALNEKRVVKIDNSYFRSEEHTSELQSRFGISYSVFCLKKKMI